MLRIRWCGRALLGLLALVGCAHAPRPIPLEQAVVVRGTSNDSTRHARFALVVFGGPAELRSGVDRLGATDARLEAATPADVLLHPGTSEATFVALGGFPDLHIEAVAPGAHLSGTGAHVALANRKHGVEIRTGLGRSAW